MERAKRKYSVEDGIKCLKEGGFIICGPAFTEVCERMTERFGGRVVTSPLAEGIYFANKDSEDEISLHYSKPEMIKYEVSYGVKS